MASRETNIRLRSRIIRYIRDFFYEHEYLEVETPCLIPAPAPEAHIDAIKVDGLFLHTSPELCMKRLLCSGHSRIFQICRCFRNDERGELHLPEFTILEWYHADINYSKLMNECQEMIQSVAHRLEKGETINYQGMEIDLKGPWQRISVKRAFEKYSTLSLQDALDSNRFDEVMVEQIEPRLRETGPIFLYDYPAQLAALSRLKHNDPTLAERFELYIGGLELANAFSELTDPDEQARRFRKEIQDRERAGKTLYPLPEKFIRDLGNMPDAAGIALGVDRLVMLFTDTARIDDVVCFTPEEL
ncbi:MAG: EF-P lysine aminoacylase GenX [Deltaproteobacteria bacterium]|nr:EF-P lysine aminoacylase GenX [Deltaproteobacteria bacterium]